jgi:ssRNA-specific RNase YbeY (16S rRNA maturation enzyme)
MWYARPRSTVIPKNLLTHGILHLLGYDHEDPEGTQEMRAHEDAALNELQITRGADDAAATT